MERKPRLTNAPVIYVLTQVKFPRNLKMPSHLPELQEKLKDIGYPRFFEEKAHTFPLGNVVPAETRARWIFTDKEAANSVIVSEDFVVCETSNYKVINDFLEQTRNILNVITPIVGPDLCERVGLRFINLIRKEEEASPLLKLREGMRGPSFEKTDLKIRESLCYTEYETSEGTMVIRAGKFGGSFLPPDITSTKLQFHLNLKENEEVVVLDIDHFSVKVFDFKSEVVIQKVDSLHRLIDEAFITCVSENALKSWR